MYTCKYKTIDEWRQSGKKEISHLEICAELYFQIHDICKFVHIPDDLIGVIFRGIKII